MRTLISTIAGLTLTLPATVTLTPVSLSSLAAPAIIAAAPAAVVLLTPSDAEAKRRGGGHRGGRHRAGVRSGGRHSVHRGVHRPSTRPRPGRPGHRPGRPGYRPPHHGHYSRRDVHHHYHHGSRRYYDGWGYGAGLAVGAATSLAIGAVVASLPANCTGVTVGSVYYHRCGSTWYAPQYSGSDVTYVVVNDPR